jgi:Predicted nucleotide-binding protein containing TIR-like domain
MDSRSEATFIHYFDSRFTQSNEINFRRAEVWGEALLAFRIALLSSDRVVLPATSWFEEPACRRLLRQHDAFFADGRIEVVGTADTVAEFCALQAEQYKAGSSRYGIYRRADPLARQMPPFHRRDSHPRRDLERSWRAALADGRAEEVAARLDLRGPRRRWRRRWIDVPEALEGRAFVTEFIAPLLSPRAPERDVDVGVQTVITPAFFGGFRRALGARPIVNLVYLRRRLAEPDSSGGLDYRGTRQRLHELGLLTQLAALDQHELRRAEARGVFDVALFGRRLRPGIVPTLDKILIVHGRGGRRFELVDFLTALGLTTTRLEQEPHAGQLLMEKFERLAPTVKRAIVLIEPDDVGHLRSADSQKQLRTRQNVIFELGWLMGYFGRTSGRIIVIEDRSQGEIEWLSDLAGLGTIRVTDSIEAVGEQLRRELGLA